MTMDQCTRFTAALAAVLYAYNVGVGGKGICQGAHRTTSGSAGHAR
jgi:hypothetical protein